jgi:hypothetical protein
MTVQDNRSKLKKGPVPLPKTDSAMNKITPQSLNPKPDQKQDRALSTKKPDEEKDEDILNRAKGRFDKCVSWSSENRKEALEDRKMKAGDQWPADVMASRMQDQRPCITINKLPTFVNQITNDQRMNRPAIHFSPIGDRGDKDASRIFAGLFRFVEDDSSADIAYDTAFDDAATSGFGYFRMVTEWESEDSFNQVLKIKRIRNPFTVYIDPDSQEPDGSDMKFAFVTEMIPRAEFELKYPKADPCNWDKTGIGEANKNWIEVKDIRVAEYYEVKIEKKKLVALDNGWTGWDENISEEVRAKIDKGEIEVERERDAECRSVKWYKLSAKEIIERRDCVGNWIWIFPVIGTEIDLEGKVKLSGVVRNAKSPQQQYNYISTQMTEVTALVPKAPYIGAEGQFEGHEDKWRQANTKSYPYLEYRPVDLEDKPAPPPQRQPPPGVPAGLQQLLQNAQQDMMAVTGIRFDGTMHERMNDESGVAINALARTGDLTNYHYIDNLARSMKHLGRCFIDAVPHIYDNRRVLTILREDGSEERVQLDPNGTPGAQVPASNGKTLSVFNPTVGKYGVKVTIGPSFATKRIEASSRMLEFAKIFPNFSEAFADLIAKNMDWPESELLTGRIAKVVATKYPGIMTPDMKDVPPAVQAQLFSLDRQLKQLLMERMQMMRALNDKSADRAVKMDKNAKDFEAKLLAIAQKADASFNTHIAAEIRAMIDAMHEGLTDLQASDDEAA